MAATTQRIILIIGFILLLSPVVHATEQITWMRDNLPPAFIHDGPDANNGIVDGVVEILIRELPDFQHKITNANMLCIMDAIRHEEKVCYAGFLKTPEREQYIAFSLPHVLTVANRLVVRRTAITKQFPADGQPIALTQLLTKPGLRIGLSKGRSYGDVIDRIIQQSETDALLRAGNNSLAGLLNMIAHDRLDATIGFPWELTYVAQKIDHPYTFRTIPIQETADQMWYQTYVGCPKNHWGKRIIQQINTILQRVRPHSDFYHHQQKWFPYEMADELRAAYKQHILAVTP